MATGTSSIPGPSGYELVPLREGADFTLYRGREHGNPSPVLATAPSAEQPLPETLRRLEHEQGPGQPLELTRFLRIAIGLALSLGQVHRHGLIHKDIKPANVLVDDAGNVWLTGFGIASQLPRERQAPEPVNTVGLIVFAVAHMTFFLALSMLYGALCCRRGD